METALRFSVRRILEEDDLRKMEANRIRYTLRDLEDMAEDTISLKICADVLGCETHELLRKCLDEPEGVGFHFIRIGHRTIIPREGFINWMKGIRTETKQSK